MTARGGGRTVWRKVAQVPRHGLTPPLRGWLFDTDSLTQRLVDSCGAGFSVRLVGQHWRRPLPDEGCSLGMGYGEYALQRHVYLKCHDRAVVFARTLIPRQTLQGRCRRLRYLRERPLGAVLFADKTMSRGEMEVACLRPGDYLYRQAVSVLAEQPPRIWARRSLFYLAGRPLLVCEIFLPAFAPEDR